IHLQRGLFLTGAHPARSRHPGRLRPAQERDRETLRARAHGAARDGDDGLSRFQSPGGSGNLHHKPTAGAIMSARLLSLIALLALWGGEAVAQTRPKLTEIGI